MRFAGMLLAASVLAATAAQAATDDPASGDWNYRRVNLWVKLCAATAPTFADFETAATAEGFHQKSPGRFALEDDIVASLVDSDGTCGCLVSFRSDDHPQVEQLLGSALSDTFGSQFEPGGDTVGTLQTEAGPASVRASTKAFEGHDWSGLSITSTDACP